MNKTKWSASIRVVKSLVESNGMYFDTLEVIRERLIEAVDKNEVKQIIKDLHPEFFQNGKIYEKETKDQAQFFYVVIKKLSNWELNEIKEGEWICDGCKTVHENKLFSRPRYTTKPPFQNYLFCDNGDQCLTSFKNEYFKDNDFPDNEHFVKSDSPNYIYKCTEKSTGKSYVGKTRNAPFFRWWNHLTHSSSPFGLYLRKTQLSDWTFEVLEVLPSEMQDSEVMRIESEYIIKFNCIEDGFNSTISNKSAKKIEPLNKIPNQTEINW